MTWTNGPLARYVTFRVAHSPGMLGTFSPPQRVSDPDMPHGTCVTHEPWCMQWWLTRSFLWSRWREKRSRYSRRNFSYLIRGPWWSDPSVNLCIIRAPWCNSHWCIHNMKVECIDKAVRDLQNNFWDLMQQKWVIFGIMRLKSSLDSTITRSNRSTFHFFY